MENLLKIEKQIRAGNDISYEDYQKLRAYREYIDDLEEELRGFRNGTRSLMFGLRSVGQSLAIVVGHTQNSPGASGTSPINQSEYPWNKDLAAKIKQECQNRGVESKIFYRDGIGISGAYKQVKSWGAACVMELHFNAFNGSARGTETLYDADTNSGSQSWAGRLQQSMLDVLGTKDRGLKERDPGDRGYKSVSSVNIPSALIEPFFGDNTADAQIGHSSKDDLAAALAEAAAGQLNVS